MLGSLNSWKLPMIEKMVAMVSAGRSAGTLMDRMMRNWPAPSIAAASYSEGCERGPERGGVEGAGVVLQADELGAADQLRLVQAQVDRVADRREEDQREQGHEGADELPAGRGPPAPGAAGQVQGW